MAESVSPSPAVPAGGTKGVPSKIRVGAGWRDGIESPDAARALEGWAASRLWRISPLLTALLLVALAPLATAASFPCDKARSQAERWVCRSPELSELDEYLGRYHAAARISLAHADNCLIGDQRAWLRAVRDPCRSEACLKQVYLERLAVLHAVQPGVARLRAVELPRVSPLVWIVAPASDQVAAPRNLPTQALVARGRILDEVANGDGHVLESSGGRKIVIQTSMLLEEPSSAALAELARLQGAGFEIRGRVDAQDTQRAAFAAGHCIFVYRTSP